MEFSLGLDMFLWVYSLLILGFYLPGNKAASYQHVAVPQTSGGNSMFVTFSHLGVMPNGFGHAHVAFHINVSANQDLVDRGIYMLMRYHERLSQDQPNGARAARAMRKLGKMARIKSQIEMSPEWTRTVTGDKRERRQVLAAIGVANFGLSIYNRLELVQLKKEMTESEHQRSAIINEVDHLQQSMTANSQTMKKLANLTDRTIHRIHNELGYWRQEEDIMEVADEIEERARFLLNGIRALLIRRLDPAIMAENDFRTVLLDTEQAAKDKGYVLLVTSVAEMLQSEANWVSDEQGFTAFLHVPMAKAEEVLEVFRFKAVPFEVDDKTFAAYQPGDTVLVINEQQGLFDTMTEAELDQCAKQGHFYMCGKTGATTKTMSDPAVAGGSASFCLLALYHQEYDTIKDICQLKLAEPYNGYVLLADDSAVVMNAGKGVARYQCAGTTPARVPLFRITRIHLDPGCTLTTDDFVINTILDVEIKVGQQHITYALPFDVDDLVDREDLLGFMDLAKEAKELGEAVPDEAKAAAAWARTKQSFQPPVAFGFGMDIFIVIISVVALFTAGGVWFCRRRQRLREQALPMGHNPIQINMRTIEQRIAAEDAKDAATSASLPGYDLAQQLKSQELLEKQRAQATAANVQKYQTTTLEEQSELPHFTYRDT